MRFEGNPTPKPPASRPRRIQGDRMLAKWNSTLASAYLSTAVRTSTSVCTEVVSTLLTELKSKIKARSRGRRSTPTESSVSWSAAFRPRQVAVRKVLTIAGLGGPGSFQGRSPILLELEGLPGL